MSDEYVLIELIDTDFDTVREWAQQSATRVLGPNHSEVEDVAIIAVLEVRKKEHEDKITETRTRNECEAIIRLRAKLRAVDVKRREKREKPSPQEPFTEIEASPKSKNAGQVQDPHDISVNVENTVRREILFQQVYREYVSYVESRDRHLEKEIIERHLHGEEEQAIASRLRDRLRARDPITATYNMIHQAKERLRSLLATHDKNRSIAPTFFGRDQKHKVRHTVIQSSVSPDSPVQSSAKHMVAWICKNGGFCPSATRLQAFAESESENGFEDVVFHVYEKQFCGYMENVARISDGKGCSVCRNKVNELYGNV